MFTINGNLTEFTQWEQGYSLTNPNMKAGDAVQFFSGAGDGSIMTAKEEGGVVLVEVPNIMLQHASNITARFVGGGDYTSFSVIGRKKPKDYVFIDNEYKEKEPTGGGGGNSTYNVEYIVDEVIEQEQFKENTTFKKVKFDNVTSIGFAAFYQCTELTEVNFPNATSIEDSAFSNCDNLTEVNFPNATSIGDSAFSGCDNLTEVNFPNATSIEGSSFESCYALTTVNFPNVTSIGDSAFESCYALTTVNFPNVTSIGDSAFTSCYALKSLIVRTPKVCDINVISVIGTEIVSPECTPTGEGFIYVPSALLESYIADFIPKIIELATAYGTPMDEATATYIATAIFRPLEDYTVDGTVTGELDESKI